MSATMLTAFLNFYCSKLGFFILLSFKLSVENSTLFYVSTITLFFSKYSLLETFNYIFGISILTS
jgi:hypothetical protein